MNTHRKISRTRIAALFLSAALLAAALAVRQRARDHRPGFDPEFAALEHERKRLAAVDPNELPRLRAEIAALRAAAGTDGSFAIPAGWRLQHQTAGRILIQPTSMLDWSTLLESVRQCEQRPGWQLVSLDLRSHGSRHHRTLAAVDMVLERASATPGRPPVGPVAPGGTAPAKPRNAGRSSPLRRPSACADRRGRPASAPVPDFAPLRARPSGSGRRIRIRR